jgi:hypothetical protein
MKLAHRAAMPAANGGDKVCSVGISQDEIAGMITKFDYANMPIGRPPKASGTLWFRYAILL